MRKRFLFAATALAAVVPTLATAQARPPAQQPRPATPPAPPARPPPPAPPPPPATPPAQQPRPAATPARPAMSMGTAQRAGAIEIDVQPTTIILRDEALWSAAIGGT